MLTFTRASYLAKRGRGLICLAILVVLLQLTTVRGSQQEDAAGTERDSAEETAPSSQKKEEPAILPAFQNLRYEEEWSVLKPALEREGYHRLKFIPLNQSQSVYLSIGGQLRLRAESWWNFSFGDESDLYGLSRARVHADLYLGSRFRVFVEGKSSLSTSRTLPGGRRNLDVDSIDFQNAFVDLGLVKGPATVILRPGRQELQFGGQRLVSPLDWANTRRTFDGVRGIVRKGAWRFDGFWSEAVDVDKYSLNPWNASQKQLYGLYGSRDNTLDFYWLGYLNKNAQFGDITGREDRQTVGVRNKGEIGSGGAGYELEAAYQFGDLQNADISAFMFTGQMGYRFDSTLTTPRVYTNLDLATGDNDPADNRVQTFNQLFPLGHAYLGYIDLVGRQNIVDWSGGLALNPVPKWTLTGTVHHFWRQNPNDALYSPGGAIVRAGDAGSSRSIGTEVDLTLGYSVNRWVNLNGGYSHFFPGTFIRESGPDNPVDFLYFVFQITF